MVTFAPLRFEHLARLTPSPAQQIEYAALLEPHGERMIRNTFGLSAWTDGACIALGGVCPLWPGRAEAWAIFSADAGSRILPVARHMKFVLDGQPHRRLEITVKVDNVQGNRLARLWGFGRPEGKLRAYHPDGSDMYMYARIKK